MSEGPELETSPVIEGTPEPQMAPETPETPAAAAPGEKPRGKSRGLLIVIGVAVVIVIIILLMFFLGGGVSLTVSEVALGLGAAAVAGGVAYFVGWKAGDRLKGSVKHHATAHKHKFM